MYKVLLISFFLNLPSRLLVYRGNYIQNCFTGANLIFLHQLVFLRLFLLQDQLYCPLNNAEKQLSFTYKTAEQCGNMQLGSSKQRYTQK